MPIRLIVIISQTPGAAETLLAYLSAYGRQYQVRLFSEGGISKEERQLLRLHGWSGGQGTRLDAAQYVAQSASPVLLVPPSADLKWLLQAPPPEPEPAEAIRNLAPEDFPQPPPPPKVKAKRLAAFLVATHNRPRLLRAVLHHLSKQVVPPGWGYEILVGGQAADVGREVVERSECAQFFPCPTPKVTDKLNLLARRTQADLLLMADDDDLQPPDRLWAAVRAFEGGAAWAASGPHRFLDLETGAVALWNGKAARGLVGTSVSVSREVFLKAGGYPSVPAGKDGHLAARIRRTSPSAKFKDISDIGEGILCIQHRANLNTRPFPQLGETTKKGWFSITGQGSWREAELTDEMRNTVMGLMQKGNQRIGSLASIPSREEGLRVVVRDLLPQLDHLNVYLNGYRRVPRFLIDPKITVARSQDHGDRGDAGKFFWAGEVDGYHLSFDDDIHYPPDVVERLVAVVDQYDRKVAVSAHGSVISQNPRSYYRDRTLYHCTQELAENTPVHVLGTGVACFHTDHMRVSRDDFPEPNMADIWFALLGQKQKIPFFTIKRPKGYLEPMPVAASIFDSSRDGDHSKMDTAARQTKLVKAQKWQLYPAGRAPNKAMTVFVFTYNRPESLLALLRDLVAEREANHPKGLFIRVYDDASTKDYSKVLTYVKQHDIQYVRAARNYGKQGHARWVTRAFQDAQNESASLFAFLPDDVRLLPGGLDRAARIWAGLDDSKKATLSLAVCSGRVTVPCWTGVPPVQHNADTWKTGWVDGLFLCGRKTLEVLKFQIPPIRTDNENLGSGMGRSMSLALHKLGWSMYRVDQSVVVNLPDVVVPSQMNPKLRGTQPITMLSPFNEPGVPDTVVVDMRLGARTLRFHTFAGDHIGRALAAGQLYEGALLGAIRQHGREGLYLDIGAFIGTHTAYFSVMCPSTVVISVEANPDHFAVLRRNIEDNQLFAYPVFGALLDGEARATSLPADPGNRGMAQVRVGGEGMAFSLAEILAGGGPLAVLKIDVEGCEPSVLRSGAEALRRARPLIVAEAATAEAVAAIEAELPPGYVRSAQYNATPTFIWSPKR